MKISGKGIQTFNNFNLKDAIAIKELSKNCFQDLEKIGSGFNSLVFLYNGLDGHQYAIKVIGDFTEAQDYFKLKSLQGSKYFPKIFMFGHNQKTDIKNACHTSFHSNLIDYMVVELVKGETIGKLHCKIRNRELQLTEEFVRKLIHQYHKAVKYAACRGWHVGDLSNPENMMVDNNDNLIMIDLGYFRNNFKKKYIMKVRKIGGNWIERSERYNVKTEYGWTISDGLNVIYNLLKEVIKQNEVSFVA